MRVSSMTEELKGEALSESPPSSIQKKVETDGRSKEKRRDRKDSSKEDNSVSGSIGVSGNTGVGSSSMAESWFYSGEANSSAFGSGAMGSIETQHGC